MFSHWPCIEALCVCGFFFFLQWGKLPNLIKWWKEKYARSPLKEQESSMSLMEMQALLRTITSLPLLKRYAYFCWNIWKMCLVGAQNCAVRIENYFFWCNILNKLFTVEYILFFCFRKPTKKLLTVFSSSFSTCAQLVFKRLSQNWNVVICFRWTS